MSRPQNGRRTTACIVHSLLEKQDGVQMEDHDASYEGLAQERRMDKDPHSHAELSKKLAQIRLKLHVRNIFILGKAHDETLIKYSREAAEWLLTREAGYTVYVFLVGASGLGG
jgi:NAD+ kinase